MRSDEHKCWDDNEEDEAIKFLADDPAHAAEQFVENAQYIQNGRGPWTVFVRDASGVVHKMRVEAEKTYVYSAVQIA